MSAAPPRLPGIAAVLGVAGLIPQAAALASTLHPEWRYIGLAAGYFYASLIFSFLGGIWWGIAASRLDAPRWLFGISIVPSLIAFLSGVPWMTGQPWPGPSLQMLGVGLIATLGVDWTLRRRGLIDERLWQLRLGLSGGLGLLTLALAGA